MRAHDCEHLNDSLARMAQDLVTAQGEVPIHSLSVRMEMLDGKLIGEAYAGQARPDSSTLMLASQRVHIASVAKTFTAVLVLQLAEEGKLGPTGIDATFADLSVLPISIVERLHRKDGVSSGNQITLRHLLTHTSGIRDAMIDDANQCGGPARGSLIGSLFHPGEDSGRRWETWDPLRPDDKHAGVINFFLASGIADAPLSLPGERFHYSDTGFVLLGMLVESITKQPLHEALNGRILDPLGMHDTYLAYRDDPPLGPCRRPEAEVYAGAIALLTSGVSLSFDWAGGGLVSTMPDLIIFMRGLAAGRLFSKAGTWDEMTDWVKPDGLDVTRSGVGLGLFRTYCNGVELWGHSGAWGTKIAFSPKWGLVFAGTINQVWTKHDWHHPFIERALNGLTTTD